MNSEKPDPFIAPVCHEQIKVLYEDDSILLIDKPSGLLSLSGKNPLNLDSVHYRLAQDYPGCRLLHRLDFGTSGIMLVALSKQVNERLSAQFRAGTVEKSYIAILDGHLRTDQGRIEAPIAKGEFPLMKVCQQSGKPAVSEFEVMERLDSPNRTRVVFRPVTGRTHQLRVHSQWIGHSILGCDLYPILQTDAASQRLLLHAESIAFRHPTSGAVQFACKAPF